MSGDASSTDPVSFRPARPGDLPALLALLESEELPAAGVAEWLPGFVVAEHDGELIGAAGTERYGAHALLRSVVVAPAWRGRGIGARLVESALAGAAREGARSAWLLTTTAERYFPRHGFRTVPREEVPAEVRQSIEFREACPASAAAMTARLGTAAGTPVPVEMAGRHPRVEPSARLRVLFLCTANSARSQIAEALLRAKGAARFVAGSAGTHPAGRVNPYALAVLREHGIEADGAWPKTLADVQADGWDVVITVCDAARESCPVVPGVRLSAHWGVDDPAAVEGDAGEKLAAFREAAAILGRRIDRLLALPLDALDAAALLQRLRAIGSV